MYWMTLCVFDPIDDSGSLFFVCVCVCVVSCRFDEYFLAVYVAAPQGGSSDNTNCH